MDALGPRTELILRLVGGELEKAVVDKDCLSFGIENGKSVGQQLGKALEQLCLHRVDLPGVGALILLLPLVELDLPARVISGKLVQAAYVSFDMTMCQQLRQNALPLAMLVKQRAQQDLGLALSLIQRIEEVFGRWACQGECSEDKTGANLPTLMVRPRSAPRSELCASPL
jgi:hypothetical protein